MLFASAICHSALGTPIDLLAQSECLYAKSQYSAAADLLRQSLKENPNSSESHYLLGNCLLRLGKTSDAKKEYATALASTKNDSVRHFCETALSAISAHDDSPAQEQTVPVNGLNSLKLPEIPQPDWRSISQADRDHIIVQGSGAIFSRATQDIYWAVSIMPRQFKDALWAKDVTVVVCSNLQEIASQKGWGEFKGNGTWADLFGFTSGKSVYIAVNPGQKPYVFKRPGMVLTHEIGHAFDFNAASTAQSPGMEEAYSLDLNTQSPSSIWHKESRLELFADLVSGLLLDSAKADFKRAKFEGQRRDFPRSCSYVKECLSRYEH